MPPTPLSPSNSSTPTGPAQRGADLMLGADGVQIVRRFLLVVMAVCVASLAHGLGTYGTVSSLYGAMGGCVAAAGSYALLQRGYVQASVQVILWALTALVLSLTVTVAGVRTPALFILPGLCIFAAWVAGLRTALAVFSVCSVFLLGLVMAEAWWGYHPPTEARTSTGVAIVLIPSIFISLLVAVTAIRSYQRQIATVVALSRTQQEQLEALRLSEERFFALFRANPTPSSTVDDSGRTMEVNGSWETLFGISQAAAHGKTTEELGLWVDPSVRSTLLAEMKAQGKVAGLPVALNTAQGPRSFEIYISAVETTGRQRLVTSLLDQTDRLAAEAAQHTAQLQLEARVAQRTAELQQALETLKAAQTELVQAEKLASLGAMVAGISHELNTPIGNTLTVASTLQDQVRSIQAAIAQGELRRSTLTEFLDGLSEMSDLITRSSNRAARLIQSFKQVAIDRTTEQQRPFLLREVCDDIVASIKAALRKTPVTITVEVPADLHCDSHPGPLGQVLTNLLQIAMLHAFGARTDGHITLAAALDSSGPAPMVVLTVTDDGVGMSEHTRSHAFDPFFTTRFGQGGSGLGLSISHTIATTTLEGSLSVASQPGSGCCFTLRMAQRVTAAALPHQA